MITFFKPPAPLLRLLALFLCLLLAPALRAQTSIRPSSASGGFSYPSSNTQRSTSSSGAGVGSSSASSTRDYRNNTLLGDALIQVDPETRSLVIVADEDTKEDIMKVIKNLDRPKPQVLIKVLFAQVTLDKSIDFGIEGNYSFKAGGAPLSQILSALTSGSSGSSVVTTTSVSSSGSTTTTNTMPIAGPVPYGVASGGAAYGLAAAAAANNGGFFTLNSTYANATLYALAQKGNVNVLSRPSILARNNQEAVIVVGQEVPFVTNSQITDTGATINTIQYQDVGIILRVTPFITSAHTVEMIVSPEISSLSNQTVPISPTVNAPVINKTSAETVVVTPDATTVVIGGMMQKQETANVSKVPILGDIPIFGNAFRRTTKGDIKTELLIFLTPYIVEGTENLKDLTVDETNRTDLPEKIFSAGDVDRYLDTLKVHADDPKAPATDPEVRKAVRVEN